MKLNRHSSWPQFQYTRAGSARRAGGSGVGEDLAQRPFCSCGMKRAGQPICL